MAACLAMSQPTREPGERVSPEVSSIRWRAYEGLSPGLLSADQKRLREAARMAGHDGKWPNRDTYALSSLQDFPLRVSFLRATDDSPVPLIVLPSPDSVDRELKRTFAGSGAPTQTELRRIGEMPGQTKRCSLLAYFPAVEFGSSPCGSLPWPSWADPCLDGTRTPSLINNRVGIVNSTSPRFNTSVWPCLQKHGAKFQQSLVFSRAITDWIWTNVRVLAGDGPNLVDRPELVFPLWESLGVARARTVESATTDRVSEMSARVTAVGIDWTFGGQSGFVQGRPIRVDEVSELQRQFIVLPERCANSSEVPVVCIYKDKTWKPFSEDYVIRMGNPSTTEGLRAVCVFMSATQDQLEALFRAIGVPPDEDAAAPAK